MSRRALEVETQTVEAPTLVTLAERIGALHREIKAQPGRYEEMHKLLTMAREDVGPGGWLKWLADNEEVLGFGERQAQLYLRSPELRSSDLKARAADQKERRAATKAPKATTTESAPEYYLRDGVVVPHVEVIEPEVLPETEQTKVADLPAEEQCLTRAAAVKRSAKALKKGPTFIGFPYGVGGRSIEACIDRVFQDVEPGGEFLVEMLADARQVNHPDFPQWMKRALAWHTKIGAGLDMLQKGCPTPSDLEAVLHPDDDQQQDEAADPAPDSVAQP